MCTIRKELPDILDFQEFMKYLQNFSKYKNITISPYDVGKLLVVIVKKLLNFVKYHFTSLWMVFVNISLMFEIIY